MACNDFPNNPNVDDIYDTGTQKYRWDGFKWVPEIPAGGDSYWEPGTDPDDIVNTNSGKVRVASTQPNLSLTDTDSLGLASFGAVQWRDSADEQQASITKVGTSGEFRLTQRPPVQITFYTDNTERMRIAGDGNVGIGTDAPAATLDVSNNSGNTEVSLSAVAGTAASLNLKSAVFNQIDADTTLGFNVAGPERMRIDSNGNVGIGPASASSKLAVTCAAGGTSLLLTDATNSTLNIRHASPSSQLIYESGGVASQCFWTNGSERMRIASSGNVGIGATNPGAPLEVAGDVLISASGNTQLELRKSGLSIGAIRSFTDRLSVQATDALTLVVGGGERVRVTNTGVVTGLFTGTGITQAESKFQVVAALPGTPDPNTIYFVTA